MGAFIARLFGLRLTVDHAVSGLTTALRRLVEVAEHHEAKRDEHDEVIDRHIALANAAEAEAERARAIHSRISALVSPVEPVPGDQPAA